MTQQHAPTEEEVMEELGDVPEYCKQWPELHEALLSAKELQSAGKRQQDLHTLLAFPLALEDTVKMKDTSKDTQ